MSLHFNHPMKDLGFSRLHRCLNDRINPGHYDHHDHYQNGCRTIEKKVICWRTSLSVRNQSCSQSQTSKICNNIMKLNKIYECLS